MRQLKLFDEPSELPKIDSSWRWYYSRPKVREVHQPAKCRKKSSHRGHAAAAATTLTYINATHARDIVPVGDESVSTDITTMCHCAASRR